MKILGHHGELGWEGTRPVPKREIEVEEGERLMIMLNKGGEEAEVMEFFVPGILSLEWKQGAKLPRDYSLKS